MSKHIEKICQIAQCHNEAECFIEGIKLGETLYLCRDHVEKMSEEYEPVTFPIYTNNGILLKVFEIGEYCCSDDCKTCNF